ncbi:MAG: S1-like domain-containing RNA-binding protein [Bacteroidales bacterium]
MAEVGKYNKLKVVKELEFGLYLDGEALGEILLPRRYVPEDTKPGDELEVFLYFDSEDRIIATTLKPYATVGEFAYLDVASTNRIGAFLDWGLPKDLLVPFREQRLEMQEGKYYIVYIYLDDESGRIAASAKIDKFLDNTPVEYSFNQQVDILIVQQTDLGFKVVVNNQHSGMIYTNEIFTTVNKGDRLKAYVKHIREDEKLDISLQELGYDGIDGLSRTVMQKIESAGGRLMLSDKSSSEEIAAIFGCSKKSYKKAIGALYKERIIKINPDSIELIKKGAKQ